MNIGVPRETVAGEGRVALVPESVKKLVAKGHTVLVEAGAGRHAFAPDDAFLAAGAQVVEDWAELARHSDIIAAVHPISAENLRLLTANQGMVGLFKPLTQIDWVVDVANAGITSFSLDALPRITRAQSMDVLSSQATMAGYRAISLAMYHLPKVFPLMMTAAGTVVPARVLVLGAGVAGLQAVATAKRLGAQVVAFDTRPAVKEQVESLGAGFLTLPVSGAEDAGGYARAVESDIEAQEREVLREPVASADVIVTTAMVPGGRAPLLVSEEMVRAMKPGSVIVDLAAEAGGNCELTRMGETVAAHGVLVIGPYDLAREIPAHASQLYGQNMQTFLTLLADKARHEEDGQVTWDLDGDEVVRATCITHGQDIVHREVRRRVEEREGGRRVVQ